MLYCSSCLQVRGQLLPAGPAANRTLLLCIMPCCVCVCCAWLCPQVRGLLLPVLQQPPSQVLWCPVHPAPDDAESARHQHPLFFDPSLPKPLRVEVS
jgi:hypothetical protein